MPTDGYSIGDSARADYPNVYNIERDPHEDLFVGGLFGWVPGPALKVVEDYLETVKYPERFIVQIGQLPRTGYRMLQRRLGFPCRVSAGAAMGHAILPCRARLPDERVHPRSSLDFYLPI